jgi:hypothetical protein
MEMHQRGVRVVYFEAGTRYLIHWVDRDRGRRTAFWRTQCSVRKVLVQLCSFNHQCRCVYAQLPQNNIQPDCARETELMALFRLDNKQDLRYKQRSVVLTGHGRSSSENNNDE